MKLNFTHIVALVNTYLEMPIPFELRNEEAHLINNGFISENRRLRPYGGWIISMVQKYLKKKESRSLNLNTMVPKTQLINIPARHTITLISLQSLHEV